MEHKAVATTAHFGRDFHTCVETKFRLSSRHARLEVQGPGGVSVNYCQGPHRLREATRPWFKLRGALVDMCIPRGERMRRFYQIVGASCLWGACAWAPKSALRAELDAAELRWLGWMSGVTKRPHATWVEFYWRRCQASEPRTDRHGPFSTGRATLPALGWAMSHATRARQPPLLWRGGMSRGGAPCSVLPTSRGARPQN